MIKITLNPAVYEALKKAHPKPANSAARALGKYVKRLEEMLFISLHRQATPLQRKLELFSISLQKLAKPGLLQHFTRQSVTLESLIGLRLSGGGLGGTGALADFDSNTTFQFFIEANNGLLQFRVVSFQINSSVESAWQDFSPALTLSLADWDDAANEIIIDAQHGRENAVYRIRRGANQSNITVVKEQIQRVRPGTPVPATLYCVGSCPNQNLQTSDIDRTVPVDQVKTYSWDANNYQLNFLHNGVQVPMLGDPEGVSNVSVSHLVVKADLPTLACLWDGRDSYCDDVTQLASYYQWGSYDVFVGQSMNFTGLQQQDGSWVQFDPTPLKRFFVPESAASTSFYAGKVVELEYSGAGYMVKPGECYDLQGNEASCTNPAYPWSYSFNIPSNWQDAVMLDFSTGTPYLAKTTRRGVIYPAALNPDSCAPLQQQASQYNTSQLPSLDDWVNPASPSSPNYIGPWPTSLPAEPLIINGQVQ